MSNKSTLLLSLAVLLVMSITALNCGGTTDSASDSEEEPTGIELLSPSEGDYIPGNSITFEWEDIEGAENHRLRVIRQIDDGDDTVFYNQITGSTESRHTVSHFSDDGQVYCWQLSVLDTEGWSEWSDSNCFTNSEAP